MVERKAEGCLEVTVSQTQFRERSSDERLRMQGAARVIVTDDRTGAPRLIISRQRVALEP
jgi:hypothetical protein